ncbi:MAG: hypothetical protein II920_04705, partial [Clostridia bacterium]|nr:hypothetical protein [Clostridia bacterium]
VLWIALICVVLLLLIALLLMRLRQSRPEVLEQKYKNADDRLLVWYKACIVALEVEGLSMTHGYTPSGYAEKAVQMGIADESFESFSFQVAGRRYSESNDAHFDKNEAERAYKGIIGTMKLKFRFKWYLRRIKYCLGSIEQVP